jgi:uncharacterized protein (TIGR03435 family)
MKPDERNVEDVLQRSLPSAPTEEMEAALDRVFARLRSDRGGPIPAPVAQVDAALVFGWRWVPVMTAVAAMVAATVWLGVSSRDRSTDAVLETADGSVYRISDGNAVPIHAGDRIAAQEIVRSNGGGGGAVLALADGSHVEMRSQSELSVERADDGVRIRLKQGDIIVNAAKQPAGHLHVQTKDMTVSVVGTIFLVNAERDGSRVAVIEGEVRVHEGTKETKLRPGEQVSTSRTLAPRPVKEEIAWSRQADAHLAILAAFTKGMAETSGPLTPLSKTSGSVQAAPSQTAFVAARGASAQATAAKPEFEEASIRPCNPDNLPPTPPGARGGGANSFQMTPGRTHALCMTLATIIRHAYGYGPANLDFADGGGRGRGLDLNMVYGLGVEDGVRVRGGPDWVRSERYTIDAVAAGAADAATMSGPMLRALLEKRLQLKTHIETEQVPAFNLTVAKSGLKMKPVTSGACDPLPARPGSPIEDGQPINVLSPPRSFMDVRRGERPSCGLWPQRHGPNMVFVAGDVPVSRLTGLLGFRLGAVRVLDKTGLTDRFNFVMEFVLDENVPGPGVPGAELPAPPQPADVPRAATIFTALEEQLGLRLEPARAPRDFIVIDRVERPSPN